MSYEEILAHLKTLERGDILAALAYAARPSRIKRIDPVAMENQDR